MLTHSCLQSSVHSITHSLTYVDEELSNEIQEEKKQLVGQILDLQNTLDGGFYFFTL